MGFQRILIAYDGSDIAKKALQKGLELAGDQIKVDVLHVYEFPNLILGEAYVALPAHIQNNYYEYAESVIEDARKRTEHLDHVETVLKEGSPARDILKYAEEAGSDLIVLGSRGLGGFKELVLGSVSHNVVQHSKIPVLVVK